TRTRRSHRRAHAGTPRSASSSSTGTTCEEPRIPTRPRSSSPGRSRGTPASRATGTPPWRPAWPGNIRPWCKASGNDAELVERVVELFGVPVDTEGARPGQLVFAVAAREHSDGEHSGPPGREQVPD